jgi:hypothetical protein
MKEEQKQHLIDMMQKDEELGLYDIFNDEKRQGVKELIDKHILEEASWKFNPLKKLDGEFLRHAFKEGAKWQQEQLKDVYLDAYVDGSRAQAKLMYSEEEVLSILYKHTEDLLAGKKITLEEWFQQFKKQIT